MHVRIAAAVGFLAALLCVGSRLPVAAAKDKAPSGPPQTGTFQMPAVAPVKYILMSVPKDYDDKKYYPLAFVLHPMTDSPDSSKPEPYVGAWTEVLGKKGWIIASPALPEYDNESSLTPIQEALKKVMATYKIDDRRVVLIGHNAGALMAWRISTRTAPTWAAVVILSGEVPAGDRGPLKNLTGKSVYVFRGKKDASYTTEMFQADKKYLDFNKVAVTYEEKEGWGLEFPTPSAPAIAEWVDNIWPPGAYREAADAARKALDAKDFKAAQVALKDLQSGIKKAGYAAFEPRLAALTKEFLEQGRDLIGEAQKLIDADPIQAYEKAEATAKALKGVPPLDADASKALAAVRKDPKVAEALRKKEAEAAASSYMEKAAAFEAKGDLARALDGYRKAAALESSRKEEAQKKVAELEPKVAGK